MDKVAEYEICKRRGHQPSDYMTAGIPPQIICKWCGTYYWWSEPVLKEHNIPTGYFDAKP